MDKEQILAIVRREGPILPAQISSEIKTSILFASAMLSALVDTGKVRLSHLKVGGSPLYYLGGQEEKLEGYIEKLNSKQQEAVKLLQQKKILQDTLLEPAIRVALRETGDFAKPVEVTLNAQKTYFWKWHTLSKEETEEKIRSCLQQTDSSPEKEARQTKQDQQSRKEALAKQEKQQLPVRTHREISSTTKRKPRVDSFFEHITKYFTSNNISIEEKIRSTKNKHHELIITVPGRFGKVRYYCMAKNKKKITEADVQAVFTQAQLKKLPGLLLTTGIADKKAAALLATDLNIHFKTL